MPAYVIPFDIDLLNAHGVDLPSDFHQLLKFHRGAVLAHLVTIEHLHQLSDLENLELLMGIAW